jgi:hypothetical protein
MRQVESIQRSITSGEIAAHWDAWPERARQLRSLAAAVDDWQRWATGDPFPPERVTSMLVTLHSNATADLPEVAALAEAVVHWATAQGVDVAVRATARRAPSVGVEL